LDEVANDVIEINGFLRLCCMSDMPNHRDVKLIGRSKKWPLPNKEMPDRHPGPIVHAIDLLNIPTRRHAVVAHFATRPPPSSAGWKITTTKPLKLRVSARYLAAPQ
jgi:hypothetical protein